MSKRTKKTLEWASAAKARGISGRTNKDLAPQGPADAGPHKKTMPTEVLGTLRRQRLEFWGLQPNQSLGPLIIR